MDEHTLNDLLECSVCLERLDTSSKVLPCQHTFCRKCLEVIVSSRQELRCPECRILVDVKIDDLPPNVLLMRILEGMKNAAAAKTQQQKAASVKLTLDDNNTEIQKSTERRQSSQQQQQQQQQHHNTNLQQQQVKQHQSHSNIPTTSIAPVTANTATNSATPSQQQHNNIATIGNFAFQRRCLLPHAYALFDFTSTEPTDLNFKKGDLVLLKRKIDTNWFVGQLNNGSGNISEGTFPINHVQVVVPLPTPQCIALYDFKMPPNEEQGCLIFKKGTLIQVLRRVDHNWAEGCIGSTIGIFPIAFVELNALAKQLLDANAYALSNSTSSNTNPSTNASTTASVTAANTVISTPQLQQQQLRNLPPIPLLDPTANTTSESNSSSSSISTSNSNSSSNTTSPQSLSTTTTTTATINGNSTSMPSSPNQSLPTTPQHMTHISSGSSSVRFRDKREKRHSLNALLSAGMNIGCVGTGTPALSVLQSNRHSAEILSVPNDIDGAVSDSNNVRKPDNHEASENTANLSNAMPQSTAAREQQQQQQQQQSHQRINLLKTNVMQQQVPPLLPWGYLALYPYKPRKNDELELKKGCVYIVTERCLDGWFKGKNWQDITGVFPGNYVTPLRNRDQQQLMHQWKYVPLQSTPPTLLPPSSNTALTNNSTAGTSSARLQNLYQPPDLPPRQVSSALPISSVWTKPLGHTVEAFFNRHSKPHNNTKENKEKDTPKQKEGTNNAPAANVAPSACSSSTAVQLMKRLAHIKSRSKSPSSAIAQQQQQQVLIPHYSMDNPTFEDNTTNATAGAVVPRLPPTQLNNTQTVNSAHVQLHPVHVRSGSCPSQLLQSLPHELNNTTTTTTNSIAQFNEKSNNLRTSQHHQLHQHQRQQINKPQISPQSGYGSQQLKGPKERPPLYNNIRQSMDGTAGRAVYNNTIPQQQQHQLLQQSTTMLNNCPQQQQSQQQQQERASPINILTINHRKSQSLDANTLTVTALNNGYSSNNDNGGVGSTAIVAPSNVTAAAIAASATTKSMQCTRESRFRCVVPYPPNSEIELELQIGDIIYVQRKQKNGWYKGTHARTNKTGLFPASFVEPDI